MDERLSFTSPASIREINGHRKNQDSQIFTKDNSISVSKIEELEEYQNYSRTEIKELQMEEDAESSTMRDRKDFSFSIEKDRDGYSNNYYSN